jgi:hypothetical protein
LRGGFLLRTDLSNVVNTNTLLPVVDGVVIANATRLGASR